jgi:hypothetical protein
MRIHSTHSSVNKIATMMGVERQSFYYWILIPAVLVWRGTNSLKYGFLAFLALWGGVYAITKDDPRWLKITVRAWMHKRCYCPFRKDPARKVFGVPEKTLRIGFAVISITAVAFLLLRGGHR